MLRTMAMEWPVIRTTLYKPIEAPSSKWTWNWIEVGVMDFMKPLLVDERQRHIRRDGDLVRLGRGRRRARRARYRRVQTY
jgi:hypothetical protein